MSSFAVKVMVIDQPVEQHPNGENLSIIKINDFTLISAKLDDGSPRYKVGDAVIYVPEAAIVPEWLLRQGFWNEAEDHGLLAGPDHNRVHPVKLRGIVSQGIMFPVEAVEEQPMTDELAGTVRLYIKVPNTAEAFKDDGYMESIEVQVGEDVSKLLGIHKHEPAIPPELMGDVVAIYGFTKFYDFDSIQAMPDLFEAGDDVVVTEKLHGTHMQIGYVPNLATHAKAPVEDLFYGGDVYCCAKGMGHKGLALVNNEENATKPYVKMLHKLLAAGLGEKLEAISAANDAKPVRLYGEVFGPGIAKGFNYGRQGHHFAVFDIQIGDDFLPYDQMLEEAEAIGLDTVPTLYSGPFDREKIIAVRDGPTSLFSKNAHIREGVVIKRRDEVRHRLHGRKIGKWHNPAYLLKSTGDEVN